MKIFILLNLFNCLNSRPDTGVKHILPMLIPKMATMIELVDNLIQRNNSNSRIIEFQIIKGFKIYDLKPKPDYIFEVRLLDFDKLKKMKSLGYRGYFNIENYIVFVDGGNNEDFFFKKSEISKAFDVKTLETYEIKNYPSFKKPRAYLCTLTNGIFSKIDSLSNMPQ